MPANEEGQAAEEVKATETAEEVKAPEAEEAKPTE